MDQKSFGKIAITFLQKGDTVTFNFGKNTLVSVSRDYHSLLFNYINENTIINFCSKENVLQVISFICDMTGLCSLKIKETSETVVFAMYKVSTPCGLTEREVLDYLETSQKSTSGGLDKKFEQHLASCSSCKTYKEKREDNN